jgi:hypothetical protein
VAFWLRGRALQVQPVSLQRRCGRRISAGRRTRPCPLSVSAGCATIPRQPGRGTVLPARSFFRDRGGAVPAESVRSEGRGWIAVLGDGLSSGPARGMQTLASCSGSLDSFWPTAYEAFSVDRLCVLCASGVRRKRPSTEGVQPGSVMLRLVSLHRRPPRKLIARVPGSSFPAACTSGASVASLRTNLFRLARDGRSLPSAPGCPSPVQPGRRNCNCLWSSANRGRRNRVRPVAPGLASRMVGFAGGADSGCSEPSASPSQLRPGSRFQFGSNQGAKWSGLLDSPAGAGSL